MCLLPSQYLLSLLAVCQTICSFDTAELGISIAAQVPRDVARKSKTNLAPDGFKGVEVSQSLVKFPAPDGLFRDSDWLSPGSSRSQSPGFIAFALAAG